MPGEIVGSIIHVHDGISFIVTVSRKSIQELLAIEGDRIKSWKGYKTVGKGYTICFRTLPVKSKNLEQRLFEEFSRLRKLESGIEEALNRVSG